MKLAQVVCIDESHHDYYDFGFYLGFEYAYSSHFLISFLFPLHDNTMNVIILSLTNDLSCDRPSHR